MKCFKTVAVGDAQHIGAMMLLLLVPFIVGLSQAAVFRVPAGFDEDNGLGKSAETIFRAYLCNTLLARLFSECARTSDSTRDGVRRPALGVHTNRYVFHPSYLGHLTICSMELW